MLLGDDIVQADKPCLKQLMELYNEYGTSVVGVQPVPDDEVHRYGIVDGTSVNERLHKIKHLIEKPSMAEAPSNLAILGRYILTPRIFEIHSNQDIGAGGEIQLTDAIAKLTEFEAVYAYHFQGTRYDVGEKLGFIKTTLEFALQRVELKGDLMEYLVGLVKRG